MKMSERDNLGCNCIRLLSRSLSASALFQLLLLLTTTTIVCHVPSAAAAALQDSSHGASSNGNAIQESTVPNFSPQVNNEWRPVGRGDPLQNDPTFDYSPPALEQVRYWAETGDASKEDKSEGDLPARKSVSTKSEVLLLGAPSDLHRGTSGPIAQQKQPQQQQQQQQQQQYHHHNHVGKNDKVEIPLLQSKYAPVRRSYYSPHQLATRLMPPPMQTQAHTHAQMHPHSVVRPVHTEYRHSMPASGSSYMISSPPSSTSASYSSKPYYSSSAGAWKQHATMSGTPSPSQHRLGSIYDNHLQESVNFVSYVQPSTHHVYHAKPTSFPIGSMHQSSYNSQNSINGGPGEQKPWLHELLQKEVVKPERLPPPPMRSATKYSSPPVDHSFELKPTMPPFRPTYSPVTFVTLPPTTPPMKPRPAPFSTSPVFVHSTAMPTIATTTARSTHPPLTAITFSPRPMHLSTTTSRLLIPETSNLSNRPTVASMVTKDTPFKSYQQTKEPLLGPMYLIIEGHSKVKTYGKDELDPHRPKIVPIIPKREPVVRVADPNERRGTVETFQVKHLHTKKMPSSTTTTPLPPTSTTAKHSQATRSTTSASTTMATTTTSTTRKSGALPASVPLTTTPRPETSNAPTGMAHLFSFLDSSLDKLFAEESPSAAEDHSSPQSEVNIYVTPPTTILKPLKNEGVEMPLDARVGSKSHDIVSELEVDETDTEGVVTTEPAPREVRQVFDYDQLPDSRLKESTDLSLEDDDEGEEEEFGDASWLAEDTYDEVDDNNDEGEQSEAGMLERIDKWVSSDEATFDLLDNSELEAENYNDNDNKERKDKKRSLKPLETNWRVT